MYGKENTLGKMKPPTILAYQPQINFYYPQNKADDKIESPISQRIEVYNVATFKDSFLSNRRKDPLLQSHESFFNDPNDYRQEIEKRFKQSNTNKGYVFPRKFMGPMSRSGSIEELARIVVYDLNDQKVSRKATGHHTRTKTDGLQIPRSQIDMMVTQQVKPNRGQSAGRQVQRIKTEGNQPEDLISITNIKQYNPRLTQPIAKKPEVKNFDAYRLMFGVPAQSERSTGKKQTQLSVPRNNPASHLKTYSKSPLIVQQQQQKGLNIYGIGATGSSRLNTGPKTERKAYLNLGTYRMGNHQDLHLEPRAEYQYKDRMQTMPNDFEEVPPLNDLIMQYERLKMKQIDLITKHGQFVGQMRQDSKAISPQQRPKHQRTSTFNERNPWLKTEPNELEIGLKRKAGQKTNYFQQKKESNFR